MRQASREAEQLSFGSFRISVKAQMVRVDLVAEVQGTPGESSFDFSAPAAACNVGAKPQRPTRFSRFSRCRPFPSSSQAGDS